VRAKEEAEAEKLMHDAQMLADAGCFAITLEKVPAKLATEVTKMVKCPTIGIGAGNGCDGQVLVYQDMLGFTDGFTPKFVKKYADLHSVMLEAFRQYKEDCEQRTFPSADKTYAFEEDVMEKLRKEIELPF
jgi:3-methyl-2-oxobutanoate hydroxymethyltransferase